VHELAALLGPDEEKNYSIRHAKECLQNDKVLQLWKTAFLFIIGLIIGCRLIVKSERIITNPFRRCLC
jgi:hypothetical protein